jgi:hypothetical protein
MGAVCDRVASSFLAVELVFVLQSTQAKEAARNPSAGARD